MPIVSVSSRSTSSAEALARQLAGCAAGPPTQAELVLLTVPDDALDAVAAQIAWRPGQFVVHCAGAFGRDILAPATRAGAIAGVWHPLQSLARPGVSLRGARFAIDAPPPLESRLIALTEAVGGVPLAIPSEGRALYHLGATIVSNYAVALVALAADLWTVLGIRRSEAVAALAPLLAGTAANLAEMGVPAALTGPVARGDLATVERHLAALERHRPDLLTLYRRLGLAALELAIERGLADDRAAALKARLEDDTLATTAVGRGG